MLLLAEGQAGKATIPSNKAKLFLLSKNIGQESTSAARKVMPPIYFHGNYNRYKEHNNTI